MISTDVNYVLMPDFGPATANWAGPAPPRDRGDSNLIGFMANSRHELVTK